MRIFRVLALLAISTTVLAQTAADKLIQQAQQAPTLEKNLRVLTDEIGGRVPGTPAMERAVQWGVDAFKAAGADSVHTEAVKISSSWMEGNTQVEIVGQAKFRVRATSL